MKITIPSRIAPPTAPPDAVSNAMPQASTSTAAPAQASGSTQASTSTSTPKIRIKQGTSATPSSSAAAASSDQSASTSAQIKTEDSAAGGNDAGRAGSPKAGFTSSLILPGKRTRTSLTPSGPANDASGGKLHQHQTRHAANPEEIDKAYEEGMKLWQILKDHPRKDGKAMSIEFMHLPPRNDFPDYYQMIKKPISFSEIRAKIDRREYGVNPIPTAPSGILKLISDDFKQMFFNAKRYNVKGSNIYNDARKLDRLHRHTYERLAGLKKDDAAEEGAGKSEDEDGDMSKAAIGAGGGKSGSTPIPPSGSATPASGQPPKKKQKKAQQQVDDKPITLTKWLSMKVDDLVAMTDKSGRVLSEVFMQVPPQSHYPDYYQLIAKPISFQLVRSRLKNRNYQTIEKFKDDVNLIFTNAQTYNEDGSQIWQDAQQMKEYFHTIMQEEPPEFFVRPRNQSQQAVSSRDHDNADQSRFRYASASNLQGNSYPPFTSGSGDSSSVTPFSMPAQNAYDTVKFGEFDDDHDTSMEGAGMNGEPDISVNDNDAIGSGMAVDPAPMQRSTSPVKTESVPPQQQQQQQQQQSGTQHLPQAYQASVPVQTSSSIPVPDNLAPSQVTKHSASPALSSSAPLPKQVSKLVNPSQPPTIKSFTITLKSEASSEPILQYHIANSLVRQHTLTLSKDVSFVEIVPILTNPASGEQLTMSSRQKSVLVYDAETSQEERSTGSWSKKWYFRSAYGVPMTTLEIKTNNEEVYRVFLMKLDT